MNDYTELRLDISPCSADVTDVMAAMLADAGFESFVPDDAGLTAYAPVQQFDSDAINDIIAGFPFDVKIDHRATVVEGQDWNAEWDKNYFQPIVVGDRCVIHSSFHTDVPECEYDITIDPKMAFGTGHHATTSLIIAQLLSIDLARKSVMDMGTGTGILAILAAMRGASPVRAIEIDPFAHVNAVENVRLNSHPEIQITLGDASALAPVKGVDVFIANINRNVITADIAHYAATMKSGGTMLLSGFYVDDIPVVTQAASLHGLVPDSHTEHDHWACLKLIKQ